MKVKAVKKIQRVKKVKRGKKLNRKKRNLSATMKMMNPGSRLSSALSPWAWSSLLKTTMISS
jgi:hypothetical protein